LFPSTNNNDLKNSALLENGQLAADFVYIYPADLFFSRVFLPQIAKLLKKEALLGILSPADDKINLKETPILKKEKLNLFRLSHYPLILQIFQKQ